jgi:hypothetical protein
MINGTINAVLKIAFPGIGIKELVAKYAGLRKAD